MDFRYVSSMCLGWALLLTGSNAALAHELPKGVVERTTQVTVVADEIEIRYRISASAETLRDEVQRLDPQAKLPEELLPLLNTYKELAHPAMGQGLKLTLNGQPATLEPTQAGVASLIHLYIELHYRVEIPSGMTEAQLALVDKNFAKTPGYVRMALRARKGAELVKSDAEVLVVRVPRKRLSEMTAAQREAARHLDGLVRWPSSEAAERP